ncbi:hypothetical protein [Allochromatium palmeri]|uniref:Uncharacterized protein n=1 Tax=Allochromatium palmeri TaxID=231048 RepID=A0A6N8ED27_9GAMM|nr:hypothetical protein [Allochromatium palmeri]MTW21400.1 hypothetical protein [Allochromatium palmeri]
MIISSTNHAKPSSTMDSMRARGRLAASGVRAPSIRRRASVASRQPVESAMSIDDVMARYLAEQPPQLYRSGA